MSSSESGEEDGRPPPPPKSSESSGSDSSGDEAPTAQRPQHPSAPRKRILHSDSDFDADGGEEEESGAPPPAKEPSSSPSSSPTPQTTTTAKKSSSSSSSSSSDSSGDEDEAEKKASLTATQEELFGDADDLSSSSGDEANEKGKEEGLRRGQGEEERDEAKSSSDEDEIVGPRMQMDPDSDEGQTQPDPVESLIQVEAPKITADLGDAIHFVKFPNFLSVEGRPFDPETYEDEMDEEDMMDEEGRSRLKLKVENTIRWRQRLDEATGQMLKESNAKFVRWSDGSLSLHLGAEIFDVHVQPTSGDHNHLFIRQGAGLQGQDIFRSKLTFRPHSTDTLTHRKMTLSMADRSSKAHTVKVLANVGADPETEKASLIRREEERMRAAARREAQARRIREKEVGLGPSGIRSSYLEGSGRDLSSSSEEDETSISAIKKSYAPGGAGFEGQRGGGDSEDSEAGRQRLTAAKRTLDSDDSDGSDAGAAKAAKKSKVIADSDEDEEEEEVEEEAKAAAKESSNSSSSSPSPSPAPPQPKDSSDDSSNDSD